MKTQTSYLLPCNEGPYVWDKSQHLEGIGSTFQLRRPSLMAAHLMHGKWIGNLTNAHHEEDGDQSTYFGLSYLDCDNTSLQTYEKLYPNHFVYAENHTLPISMSSYISTIPVNNHTVLVYDWEHLDEQHGYMVFDEVFRKRFHKQRLLRQTLKRQPYDHWVTIHFRWGDTAGKELNHPNVSTSRSGLTFWDYCRCIHLILSLSKNSTIFLLAENFTRPDFCEVLNSEHVHFLNDSISWKQHLDIMSQSQLLIGGKSGFFVLGSHLCENCTVIHNSNSKFFVSDYEKALPKHLVEHFCKVYITCYLAHIKTHYMKHITKGSLKDKKHSNAIIRQDGVDSIKTKVKGKLMYDYV